MLHELLYTFHNYDKMKMINTKRFTVYMFNGDLCAHVNRFFSPATLVAVCDSTEIQTNSEHCIDLIRMCFCASPIIPIIDSVHDPKVIVFG